MAVDFSDFYIKYRGQPRYKPLELVEDDVIRVIIQKYEMILFTIKGEVLGEPDFGANLDELLFETTVSAEFVEDTIYEQLQNYVPEILGTSFTLDVEFAEDPENYQRFMFVNLKVGDYDIVAKIGRMV
jgi:hypothetical protein